mmetsp:Transcript_25654/g.29495  ORF Transcript_25654/g.29495 Transcript_25654/m.29495 type:complete len:183 (-) Transcript_25654:11-559(-)
MTYTHGVFPIDISLTIGFDFQIKEETVEDFIIRMQLWDLSGNERFIVPSRGYYRNASALLLMYETTNLQSFQHLDFWIDQAEKTIDQTTLIILIGCKCDLEDEREVTYEQGLKFASEYGMQFYETSAKEGINVSEMFSKLAKDLKEKADCHLLPTIPWGHTIHLNQLNQTHGGCFGKNTCSL